MPTFKIDDREIAFEPGDTIIRAAWRQGIEIPHYCWHPGLSVAANCRMCLVEVKSVRPMMLPVLTWDAAKQDYVDATKVKLTPACQQACAEGMEIVTNSEAVKTAQASVQEFLLLNHPVDCPICDQAGECKLQDYWLEHQQSLKRKDTEPVHKPKAVRFGETIVYDAERCVMCTRCIRFCDEVVGDHVLDMRERGNRNEIVLSPGRELDHDYTLMTEHVCPVGALTSRDFRFKARVWFLKAAPSVCTGCATGCNSFADFDPRTQTIQRLRPRDNADVNKFWMCDDGMMTYKRQSDARVTLGRIGRGDSARASAPGAAVRHAATTLAAADPATLAVVVSAQHSTEDNVGLVRFAREVLGATHFFLAARPDWKGDSILRDTDQNPNRRGATAAVEGGLHPFSALLDRVARGEIRTVLALGSDVDAAGPSLEAFGSVDLVALATNESEWTARASTLVPVATHFEVAGSFTDRRGVVQSWKRAVPPPAGVRAAWETLADIAREMGKASVFSVGSAAAMKSALTALAGAEARV